MLLEQKLLVIILSKTNKTDIKNILEPLQLKIGNEFNLNNVKEISVTKDFLTFDKTIINCQNEETLDDCKTKKYVHTLIEQCKCLPFTIRNYDEVIFKVKPFNNLVFLGSLLNCLSTQMCREYKS